MTKPTEERFWDKVNIGSENECWEWQAGTSSGGRYGAFAVDGRSRYVHRISWQIENGKKVPKNKVIRHSCDNSLCVNPKHLEVGSQRDNMKDMVERNRQAKEENHSQAKLTDQDVIQIREKYLNENTTYKEISKEYPVCQPQICRIITGKTRKNTDGPIKGKDY